jgi:hypothetical protein
MSKNNETAPRTIALINDVDAAIDLAHSSHGDFAFNLHNAGFNVLAIVDLSGDTRPLNRLYEKLSPAAATALRMWANHFGPVKFDADLSGFKLDRKRSSDDEMKLAREITGPMEYKREVKPRVAKTFNAVTEIYKFIQRCDKEGVNVEAISHLTAAMKAA